MGAVGEDGTRVINREIVDMAGVSERELARIQAREQTVVAARAARNRAGRPRLPLDGQVALVIDDGIATRSTALAACQVARVLAIPVAQTDWEERIGTAADERICLESPEDFFSIGEFYKNFAQVTYEEVVACLDRAEAETGAGRVGEPPARREEVAVATEAVRLAGYLTMPEKAPGIVVFVHGNGRLSSRNQYVADVLTGAGLGSLLFDLLTPEEENDRANVFDVELLAERLVQVKRWLRAQRARSTRPSATLVPAPARRRHCGLPPSPEWTSRRWCRAAAVPISPGRGLPP